MKFLRIASAVVVIATLAGCDGIKNPFKDAPKVDPDAPVLIARGFNMDHECVTFMVADTKAGGFEESRGISDTLVLARPKATAACKETKTVDLAFMCRIEDEKGILLGGGGVRFTGRIPSGKTIDVKLAGSKPGTMKCDVHPGEGSDVE